MNEIIKRGYEYELLLCLAFIDFEKVFDSVSLAVALKSVKHDV